MKRRILWALVALNVLLAVTLAARLTGEGTAQAQAPVGVHRPADYIIIPGEVSGGSSAVVYIVDTTNGMLGAMVYDESAKVLNTMPPLDLSRVFETAGGQPARGTQVAPGARGMGR